MVRDRQTDIYLHSDSKVLSLPSFIQSYLNIILIGEICLSQDQDIPIFKQVRTFRSLFLLRRGEHVRFYQCVSGGGEYMLLFLCVCVESPNMIQLLCHNKFFHSTKKKKLYNTRVFLHFFTFCSSIILLLSLSLSSSRFPHSSSFPRPVTRRQHFFHLIRSARL